MPITSIRRATLTIPILAGLLLPGCGGNDDAGEVVVYTSVDRAIVEPVFQAFTERTGIRVVAKYPADSPGGQGWVRTIWDQQKQPQGDVFLDDALLGTILLAKRELLDSYKSPGYHTITKRYKDPDGRLCAIALQPRVLIVNNALVAGGDEPPTLAELAKSRHWRTKGAVGMAGPASTMTMTHVACLFEALGPSQAKRLLLDLKRGGTVRFVADDAEVARLVASGELAMGLTDGSRFIAQRESGQNVRVAYIGARKDKDGALFIPTTASVIKGCQHLDSAHRLIDFLLSPEVAAKLAAGPGALVPLLDDVPHVPRLKGPRAVRPLKVNFQEAAEFWDDATVFARQHLAPQKRQVSGRRQPAD